MLSYYCKKCDQTDDKGIVAHRCATNAATNNATNTDDVLAGVLKQGGKALVRARSNVAAVCQEPVPGGPARTANRRSRADYNAYQRDLMKRKRAEAKARKK